MNTFDQPLFFNMEVGYQQEWCRGNHLPAFSEGLQRHVFHIFSHMLFLKYN